MAPHPITLEIESYERKSGFLLLSDFLAEPHSPHTYSITATENGKRSLNSLEIWFRVLRRKLLQPHHFVSNQDLEQAIIDFLTYYNQKAQSINWIYTAEQLARRYELEAHEIN